MLNVMPNAYYSIYFIYILPFDLYIKKLLKMFTLVLFVLVYIWTFLWLLTENVVMKMKQFE